MEDNFKEKLEFAKAVLTHNSELINLADTKAGILLGINGIILALLFGDNTSFSPIVVNLVLVTGILLGISSICSILTIFPRLTKDEERTSVYFKHVAKQKKQDYIQSWNTLESSEILTDLLSNIHNLAILQMKKYRYLRLSVIFLLPGFILLVLSVVTTLNQFALGLVL